MDSLVEGRGIVRRYGDFTAVDQVDLNVAAGECFGALGPNGAGKSSLLKMIQRLSPLTEGSVTVDGLVAGADDARIKGIIGVVPQEDALDPDLNIEQNLIAYARYFGIPERIAQEKAAHLLEFFHLDRRHIGQVRDLSGGMRRRLVIARALINDPKLLILDEPTTGLDPAARRIIWARLGALKEQGVTMLLTTHYMEEAVRLCDRIAIMHQGKVITTGVPSALVADKVGRRVIEFQAVASRIDEIRVAFADVPFEEAGGTMFVYDDANALQERAKEYAVGPLTIRDAHLEDLFLKLTGHELGQGE